MLPTCIGISGVSRYRNDASIEDSFFASPMLFPPRTKLLGALVALLAFRSIVHFPEVHMQWQTGPTAKIARIGPRPGPNDPRRPTRRPRSRPARHDWRGAPRYFRPYRRGAAGMFAN